VSIITQNVDDLHERAGSSHVLHLHGELKLSRSTADPALTFPIEGWEIREGDTCPLGSQLRPHIVWFGEAVTLMPEAERIVSTADAFVVVGTSLSVYPAASLAWAAPATCQVKAVIDPNPAEPDDSFIVIPTVASEGLARATDFLDMFL
jgi:NAD-dependent deacetylase